MRGPVVADGSPEAAGHEVGSSAEQQAAALPDRASFVVTRAEEAGDASERVAVDLVELPR
jgi:hypothetical protein